MNSKYKVSCPYMYKSKNGLEEYFITNFITNQDCNQLTLLVV